MRIIDESIKLLPSYLSVVTLKSANPNLRPVAKEIIYMESSYSEPVNQYIRTHLADITAKLRKYRLSLVYLPALAVSAEEAEYWSLQESSFSTAQLYKSMQLEDYGSLPPTLLLNTGRKTDRQSFTAIPFNEKDPEYTFTWLFNVLSEAEMLCNTLHPLCECHSKSDKCTIREYSLYNTEDHLTRSFTDENASMCLDAAPMLEVEDLSPEDRELYEEVKRKMAMLRRKGISTSVLGRLLVDEVSPSRLVVTKDYRLLLPDYNKEIQLVGIDLILYLLLLRHPEGIRQKCLTDYTDEMHRLYMVSHKGFLPERFRIALDLLAYEPRSCNEHLSRIRRCITVQVGGAEAEFYVPTSGRDVARRIPLDPKLIEWNCKLP